MNTIFNFGDPHKNFNPIAVDLLGPEVSTFRIPITNNLVYHNKDIQIVDACYGPSTVLDSLSMLKIMKKLKEDDNIIFVGSMGSLNKKIDLDDVVIPSELYCKYFKYDKQILKPNYDLLKKLINVLNKRNIKFKQYKHGSIKGVFDENVSHENYTCSLYDKSVIGLDCCESYIGLKFCNENKIKGAVLLYCSDDPKKHITNLPKKEFDERAFRFDRLLNEIAFEVLKNV